MEFLANYGIFLAKVATLVVALLVVIGFIASVSTRGKKETEGHVEVTNLNKSLKQMTDALKHELLDKQSLKREQKAEKQQAKRDSKKSADAAGDKRRVFVIDFEGDIKASAVSSLRREVTAILSLATKQDEVVVRLNSTGGMVHTYGLAASQLQRITEREVPLVVCVDKVAASGGYMMACVANKIISAPFAIIGSIGVVAQLPNFHRLLEKHDIDYELLTAGEYKRTLTLFGENTEKGRQKFIQDLEDIHDLFKHFVAENRPGLDIASVATGEIWYGKRAMDHKLVDELRTSDDYLTSACEEANVYKIEYVVKKSLQERIMHTAHGTVDRVLLSWWERLTNFKFYS